MSANTPTLVSPEEIARQRDFAAKARDLLTDRFGVSPMAYVHSYGCQQNVADGERIAGMLAEMGFGFTDSPDTADLILFNTCAVRGHAEDRVLGNVGALKARKKAHPAAILALCGCMVQQESVAEKIRASYPYVDLVFGTHVIHRLPELLCRLLEGGKRVFERPDVAGVIAEGLPVKRDSAFITVIYGEDVSEAQASALEEQIRQKYGAKTEIMMINGGQPIYYYILSVE